MKAMLDTLDNEDVAPSTGLDVRTLEFTSAPDGNTVKIQFIRPQSTSRCRACTTSTAAAWQSMSCFDGMYRSWGRIIAAPGRGRGDGRLPQLR